ncbi:MAG TPA: HAMP domain-containing sensor histidine kinase [Candidatus Limnocylindrales bacterium]|nr:HAMP domain-containing sensor histidine kinase [Candidatus Limnocylindrales bacterium]
MSVTAGIGRFGSLRWRLGLAFAVVLGVALGVVLLVAGAIVERGLIESTAARLEIEAGLITSESGGKKGITATDLAAGDLAAVLGGQETAVVVIDATGTTLAAEANGAVREVVDARLDAATYASVLADGAPASAVVPDGPGSMRVLVVAVPVQLRSTDGPPVDRGRPDDKGPPPGRGLGNQPPGQSGNAAVTTDAPNAIAQLAVSLDAVDATLAELRGRMLVIWIVVLAVGLGVAWFLTGLGFRPLGRVAAAADRVAAGDLSARAHLPEGSDEVGRLGRAFDEMVERVEMSLRSQRQFAADASHELRSPLTVLGGYVDVLARSDGAGSPEGTRTLAAMRREIDRLSRLAADLLLLSQLEAGGGNQQPRRVELGDLVEDIGAAARVIAGGRRVAVERDGSLPVEVDPDRLTQALMNLVDNAVRHTPGAGTITLSASRDGMTAVAAVANDGDPIDARHLPHLFERFYRGDRPEGSDREAGHAGLGLPIVRAIAEAAGGTVTVTSDQRKTRFAIRLPISAD